MLRSVGSLGGVLLIFLIFIGAGAGDSRADDRKPAAIAKGVAPAKHKLEARVDSLDAPPTLTNAECVKAVFPAAQGARISAAKDADEVASVDVIGLSPDVTICRVAHKQPASKDITVEVAAVKRATRAVIGKQTLDIELGPDPAGGLGYEGSVEVALFPLTTRETAVQIDQTDRLTGPALDEGRTRTTLYRLAATGFVPIVSFEATWAASEAIPSHRCWLRDVTPAAALPSQLVVDCDKTTSRWRGSNPGNDGTKTTRRTETYRWNGTRYERKSP